jgi:hypothetical protein
MRKYYCRIKVSGDNYQPQIKEKNWFSFLSEYEPLMCPIEKNEYSTIIDEYYWTKSREKAVEVIENFLKGYKLIWKKDISI